MVHAHLAFSPLVSPFPHCPCSEEHVLLPGAHLAVAPRVCPTLRGQESLSQAYWGVLVWRAHTCLALRSVWWMLPWAITGGPVVSLHVILQLRDSPQGKVIVYQEVLTPSALSCKCVSAAHAQYRGTAS